MVSDLSGAQFKRQQLEGGRLASAGAPQLTSGNGWLLELRHLWLQEAICLPRLAGAPFFSTYSLLRNKRGIRSHEKRGRLQVSLVRSLPSWHGRAICTNDTSLGGKKEEQEEEGEEERRTPASTLRLLSSSPSSADPLQPPLWCSSSGARLPAASRSQNRAALPPWHMAGLTGPSTGRGPWFVLHHPEAGLLPVLPPCSTHVEPAPSPAPVMALGWTGTRRPRHPSHLSKWRS